MATVKVRAVAGRIARVSPRGAFIPSDKFVSVEMTPYLRRLIDVHGDVEVEPTPAVVAAPPAAKTKE